MSSLVDRLRVAESLAVRYSSNSSLRDELFATLESLKKDVVSRLPADDVNASFQSFLKGVSNNSVKCGELVVFLSRIRNIISSLDSSIPIGLNSLNELSNIRSMIMNALKFSSGRFKQSFPGVSIFDSSDTRVFITGSRARGFSHDGRRLFSPGRDVDILLVGKGIFFSELAYMHLKGFDNFADKSERLGFIHGYDRRFIPPGLRGAAEKIRTFFDGDNYSRVIVNIHIGLLSSDIVKKELPFAIECL